MSVRQFMHPRNVYKTPPNFKQLAIEYPDFRKYVVQELSGKVTLDFKDNEALRSLTQTLLKKDFNLDVQIPLNKLIPTVPLRLNYILWIEDLMEISGRTEGIKGIDIGTGASCIYSLICAKKNKWLMLATELDPESVLIASKNVQMNHLADRIKVVQVTKDTIFPEEVCSQYDFCMCNPPFFASKDELTFEFKSRKETRPRPKNAFCASNNEVIVHGGEVEFINNIILESQRLRERIMIYSTMIGHKSSLVPLKKKLREIEVTSFKQTEFCQGNTTRWGLAWTFWDIDLRKVPETTLAVQRKQKIKNPFSYLISDLRDDVAVIDVARKIMELFNELEIEYKRIKESKNVYGLHFTSEKNTWSHQRRKRREKQRGLSSLDQSSEDVNSNNDKISQNSIESALQLISKIQVKSPRKRELDDDNGYYNNKRYKMNEDIQEQATVPYLQANLLLRKDSEGLHIELFWENGWAHRDVLNQILQFIKNNLKI